MTLQIAPRIDASAPPRGAEAVSDLYQQLEEALPLLPVQVPV